MGCNRPTVVILVEESREEDKLPVQPVVVAATAANNDTGIGIPTSKSGWAFVPDTLGTTQRVAVVVVVMSSLADETTVWSLSGATIGVARFGCGDDDMGGKIGRLVDSISAIR